jgi:O-antigen/teichoic acid export membrane protein
MSYIKKSLSTFATQIIKIILGMASSILIARILGPERNGKVVILMTALNLLFMLGNFGLGSSFTYHIAKGKYKRDEIISLSFVTAMLLGSIGWIIFSLIGVPSISLGRYFL